MRVASSQHGNSSAAALSRERLKSFSSVNRCTRWEPPSGQLSTGEDLRSNGLCLSFAVDRAVLNVGLLGPQRRFVKTGHCVVLTSLPIRNLWARVPIGMARMNMQ